ncbi:hypothetical protein PILCRDRAFT_821197, partial [Piloderma croceum F 1598]
MENTYHPPNLSPESDQVKFCIKYGSGLVPMHTDCVGNMGVAPERFCMRVSFVPYALPRRRGNSSQQDRRIVARV